MELWKEILKEESNRELVSVGVRDRLERKDKLLIPLPEPKTTEEARAICEGLAGRARDYCNGRFYEIKAINIYEPETGVRITVMEC